MGTYSADFSLQQGVLALPWPRDVALREETLRAEAPDMSAIEWPQPVDGDEDPDPLFDSYRDYLGQIDAYKHFQDKPTARRPKESKPLAKKPTARQPKKRGRK